MLAGCMLTACNEELTGDRLPDGKYPLDLTAAISSPQSRAGGKEYWDGGEQIAVNIGDYTDMYTIHANGSTTPSGPPYYWQTSDKATVRAWYPYSEEERTYDIADQRDGYSDLDFLYAETEGSYAAPVKLDFVHQMAKVSYTLVKGPDITDDEFATATVTLMGDKSVTVRNGKIEGTPASQTDEILPYLNPADEIGQALMVPQNMTGKPLVKVCMVGKEFLYTPDTEAAGNLQAGYHYSYTITVKATGIKVSTVGGSEWTEGDSENVSSRAVLANYTANDVKKGDYIYKDGTISDGGLRKIYKDGNIESEAVKPLPNNDPNNPVVGIVFWTPSESKSEGRLTPASLKDDKIMSAEHPACTRGLAVAVRKVTYGGSETMVWQSKDASEWVKDWQAGADFNHPNKDKFVSIVSDTGANDNINRIYGYQNTIVLRAYNEYCIANNRANYIVRPVAALDEFVNSGVCPAPAGSTGWFLPSAKELHILCNKDIDAIYNKFGSTTRVIVNASLAAAGGGDLNSTNLWSSTEHEIDRDQDYSFRAFNIWSNSSFVVPVRKDYTDKVRAVCAF